MMEDCVTPPIPPPPPPVVKDKPKVFTTSRNTFIPALVHFAVNNGDLEEVKDLIARGINLNYRMHGNTPLFLAILKEQYAVARCLVAGGADVNIAEKFRWLRQPIHLAAAAGITDLVAQLLRHGASVHAADATRMTPLHWASYKGHKDTVECLLDAGAHVNCRDDCGRSPLFRAVECNDCDVVDLLAERGAVVNTRDKLNWLPLFHCIVCGHLEMAEHLLANYTIDIDAQALNGDTALHLALTRTRSDRLDVLSLTGVDLSMRQVKAPTQAVHNAVREAPCCDVLVEMLIDYGCNMNLQNYRGDTPFKLAANGSDTQTLLLMLSAGSDITFEEHWINDGAWSDSLSADLTIQEQLVALSKKRIERLTEMCRLSIRRSLRPSIHGKISMLPLPVSLQKYLCANVDNQPSY